MSESESHGATSPAAGPGMDRVPERSRRVAWATIDGETVLLDQEGKETLGLNDVGRRIWELADGMRTIGRIVESIAEEYEVPIEQARADALQFLTELLNARALTVREG